MVSRKIVIDHDFYCTSCGRKGIPICRDKGKGRERGHLKKLFCIYCGREVNHVEVIEGSKYDKSTFMDEYRSGNFDREGNRIIPLKEWNILYYGSNWSYDEEIPEDEMSVDDWLEFFTPQQMVSA